MKELFMSDEEIVRHYRQAKDPQKDIGVLAGLNACSLQEIKAVLARNGITVRTVPTKKSAHAAQKALDDPEFQELLAAYTTVKKIMGILPSNPGPKTRECMLELALALVLEGIDGQGPKKGG